MLSADWVGSLDWGTVPEWLAAVGGIGAATGALVLLRREGAQLQDLQRAEVQRAKQEERKYATRVFVSAPTVGGISSNGTQASRKVKVAVTNESESVVNNLALTVALVDPTGVTGPASVDHRRARLMPGAREDLECHFTFDAQGKTASHPYPEAVRASLDFEDVNGVRWHIGPDHSLTRE